MDEQKPAFDPNKIYPQPVQSAAKPAAGPLSPGDLSHARVDAALDMAHLKKSAPTSKSVDAVGGLIALLGTVSIVTNFRNPIALIFNILYIIAGLAIIQRVETVRKIVVYFTAFAIIMSIANLIGLSIFMPGGKTVITIVTALFSLVIEWVVISILTQEKIINEFH